MGIRYLSLQDLLEIHAQILRSTGGIDGILSFGTLKLCVETPKRQVYGFEPYTNIFQKAASLIYEINKLHPFVDGNKRTAYIATSIFLIMNGYKMEAEVKEAVDFSLKIAKCVCTIDNVIDWIKKHTKKGYSNEYL